MVAVNLCVKCVVLDDVLIIVGAKQTIVANKTEEHWKLNDVCVYVCVYMTLLQCSTCSQVKSSARTLFKYNIKLLLYINIAEEQKIETVKPQILLAGDAKYFYQGI